MAWVEEGLSTIDLGDLRLDQRAMKILNELALAPGKTIPQTFSSWVDIKACYNFFSNTRVSETKLLDPHIYRTIDRIKEFSVVILPSDTTEIDFSSKNAMEDKERLTNTKEGIWLHSTIAVTPERLTHRLSSSLTEREI